MTRNHCLLAGLCVLLITTTARAHERGALHLASASTAAGSSVAARGEKLPKSARVVLELRGALATYPLGSVATDTAGAFAIPLQVPAQARPGTYAVVVLAEDGDVVARVDLLVTAAAAASVMDEHAGHDAPVPHASAEMMDIPATHSSAELAVIIVLILGSAGAGMLLLRPPRHAASERHRV